MNTESSVQRACNLASHPYHQIVLVVDDNTPCLFPGRSAAFSWSIRARTAAASRISRRSVSAVATVAVIHKFHVSITHCTTINCPDLLLTYTIVVQQWRISNIVSHFIIRSPWSLFHNLSTQVKVSLTTIFGLLDHLYVASSEA